MTSLLNLNDYKRAIADFYDCRSFNYDEGEWRKQVCDNLLNYSHVSKEENVLDIGTGTGRLAISAARIVGSLGLVMGVDISPQMLKQARSKIKKMALHNIQYGNYVNFEKAYYAWNNVVENPSHLSLKVSSEIFKLKEAQLVDIQLEFKAALIARQTQEGIWDDLTTLYILGRKVN